MVRAGVVLFEHTAAQREAIFAALCGLGLEPSAIGFSASRAVGRGDVHAIGEEAAAHGLDIAEGAGKAAVAYDGRIYPCIFARHLELGNVHDRSLRSVLEEPTELTADAHGLECRTARATERLSCADCRLRDAMLGHVQDEQPLLQIGRSR
jgi:radical SAM protein with 4Fe4S-binding SPASM domain